jgi:hypothetical protein
MMMMMGAAAHLVWITFFPFLFFFKLQLVASWLVRFVFRPVPAIYCQTIYVLSCWRKSRIFVSLCSVCVYMSVLVAPGLDVSLCVPYRRGKRKQNEWYLHKDGFHVQLRSEWPQTTTLLLTQHHSILSNSKTTQKPK